MTVGAMFGCFYWESSYKGFRTPFKGLGADIRQD